MYQRRQVVKNECKIQELICNSTELLFESHRLTFRSPVAADQKAPQYNESVLVVTPTIK